MLHNATVGWAALISSHAACAHQLPGTVRLAQVLSGSILQHVRQAAQAARQMVMVEPEPEPLTDQQQQLNSNSSSNISVQQQHHPQQQQGAVLSGIHQQAELELQEKLEVQPAPLRVKEQQHASHVVVPAAVVQPHQPPSPTGVKKTFYKRKLPCPPATEFSSSDGVCGIRLRLLLGGPFSCIPAPMPRQAA